MEKGKNNNGIIVLLIVIIIIMAAVICLLLTGTIVLNNNSSNSEINLETTTNENNSNVKESIAYNYSDIKGLYQYQTENLEDGYDGYSIKYELYLYDNGTFNYKVTAHAPNGYIGNYIISDNKIILNYLFSTNSGAGINVTSGTKTLVINDDGTLVDSNESISIIGLTSVTLEKGAASDESTFLQSNDFSNILNSYTITNNASTTQ